MQDANVTQRHQANMTSLVTLQVLSNNVLLFEKIKRKTFVLKKLSVYSDTVTIRTKNLGTRTSPPRPPPVEQDVMYQKILA